MTDVIESVIPDARQRILEKGSTLFVTHGYHGISMREIAEQAGVSKAALYYHFRDKEALFLGILMANLESIENIVSEARLQETTPRAQIGRIMREIANSSPEQQAIIRLASQEAGQLSPGVRQQFIQTYHHNFTHEIEAILTDGVASGYLRSMDTRQAAWILLGMMYPFFYPGHEGELGAVEDAIELMLTIFFEGATTV